MGAVQSDTDTTLDAVLDMLIHASDTVQASSDEDSRLDTLWTLLEGHKVTADQFVKLVEVLAHLGKPKKIFEEAIGVALSHDAVRIARQLAARGQELEPDNEALQKWGRILAPAKAYVNDRPPRPDLGESMNWLSQHSPQYAGKWVALDNGELLAVADSHDALLEQLGNPADLSHILTTWIP